jgi:hypothetical protein
MGSGFTRWMLRLEACHLGDAVRLSLPRNPQREELMKRALGLALAAVLLVTPMSAHDETPYVDFLTAEVQMKSVLYETVDAEAAASETATNLLAIVPAACYTEAYLAWWRFYAALYAYSRTTDGKALSQAYTEALETPDDC